MTGRRECSRRHRRRGRGGFRRRRLARRLVREDEVARAERVARTLRVRARGVGRGSQIWERRRQENNLFSRAIQSTPGVRQATPHDARGGGRLERAQSTRRERDGACFVNKRDDGPVRAHTPDVDVGAAKARVFAHFNHVYSKNISSATVLVSWKPRTRATTFLCRRVHRGIVTRHLTLKRAFASQPRLKTTKTHLSRVAASSLSSISRRRENGA